MSPQHTKGPWSAFKDIGTPAGTLKVAQEHWLSDPFSAPLVAAVYGEEGEQQANASLIAAAPELLAALEALLGWHEAFPLAQGEAELPVVQRARAAVAKAKGVAP